MQNSIGYPAREAISREIDHQLGVMDFAQLIMQMVLPSEKRIDSLLDRIEGTPWTRIQP